MKSKEWNEGMNHLDQDLVEAYILQKNAYKQKKKRTRPYWVAAVAAVVVLAIGIGILTGGIAAPDIPTGPAQLGSMPTVPIQTGITTPELRPLANLVAAPVYPKMVQKPNAKDYDVLLEYNAAVKAWNECKQQQYNQPQGYADSLTNFFGASLSQFLQGDGNLVCSPVNIYLAMAMVAETAGGNSRQQILELMCVDTIEQLRQQASYVWNAHYSDDGETTLLMGNSLWMDNSYSFHQNTIETLARQFFASSFHGDLGTPDMNKQLQDWLDTNTGGLLKEDAQNVELDPLTVFALASTVYFSADWEEKFNVANTKDAVFHTENAEIVAPFMNKSFMQYTYFWGENFGAISMRLTGSNRMWLILPDEGYTTADILTCSDYLQMTLNPGSWEKQRTYKINLRLPKFDVANQMDLIVGMKAMGVTDIFDSTISDFTPMTSTPMLSVNQINHAARVTIDEDGCIGTAFTVIGVPGTGMPPELEELDFVLDRPFLFVVSSQDNLPLFAGVVNEP